MACIVEALGMSLPGQSSHVAVGEDNAPTERKRQDCRDAVAATFAMLRAGLSARDVMTRRAFENAVTVQYALGGSTNAVLHLMALAREAGVSAEESGTGPVQITACGMNKSRTAPYTRWRRAASVWCSSSCPCRALWKESPPFSALGPQNVGPESYSASGKHPRPPPGNVFCRSGNCVLQ